MKKSVVVLAVVVALLALAGCSGGPPAEAKVRILSSGFSPSQVSVKAEGTVSWTNDDTKPHTVTTVDADSASLSPGKSYSLEFDKPGTYDYYCRFHPREAGKVEVP